ncbi:hypothetical protein Tco_0471192 [Tanacetum coccineum]
MVQGKRPQAFEENQPWTMLQRVNQQTQFVTWAVQQELELDPENPHRTLKNKGIIDSGCSRHMTGNKAYLADYQDINGGPVAFGGSRGYITGKGKIQLRDIIESVFKKDQEGILAMQELHNKMELLREEQRPLIELSKNHASYSFLPNTFWAGSSHYLVDACYD